jgi:signal-transduction protein with cAMP-binding, CBS, and nucleotidyltransferase domain
VNILGKLKIDFRTPLSSFMNKPIISIQPNCSIRETMQLMNSNSIRRLVVVDTNDKLVGIITKKDIFMQIDSNLTMVTNFVGQKYPVQYREVYERFTEYV